MGAFCGELEAAGVQNMPSDYLPQEFVLVEGMQALMVGGWLQAGRCQVAPLPTCLLGEGHSCTACTRFVTITCIRMLEYAPACVSL